MAKCKTFKLKSVHVVTVALVVMMLVIDAVMPSVLAIKLVVMLRLFLDVLHVSVQNADKVEADQNNEKEVDSDEDPERVVDIVLAVVPADSVVDHLASV